MVSWGECVVLYHCMTVDYSHSVGTDWTTALKETRKGKNENSKYSKNLLIEVDLYLKQYLI